MIEKVTIKEKINSYEFRNKRRGKNKINYTIYGWGLTLEEAIKSFNESYSFDKTRQFEFEFIAWGFEK